MVVQLNTSLTYFGNVKFTAGIQFSKFFFFKKKRETQLFIESVRFIRRCRLAASLYFVPVGKYLL